MYGLLLYCLKVAACLAVFYLFFRFLMSHETFHRFNRILILGSMALCFVLPLCVISLERELPAPPSRVEITQVTHPRQAMATAVAQPAFPWERVAAGLFFAGALVMLGGVLISLLGVLRMVRSGRGERLEDGTVLVLTRREMTPFNWGRYVVISERDMAENGTEILLHERAHRQLHHSWDLLLVDLMGCLQWFNPAMWLLRRELRAIHEYEADEAVLSSGVDARQYQLLLLKKAVGARWYSVANSLNHSKLKNRIAMMLRQKSSRWAVAKVLVLLPLTGLALGAFAQTSYVQPEERPDLEVVAVSFSSLPYLAEQDAESQPNTPIPEEAPATANGVLSTSLEPDTVCVSAPTIQVRIGADDSSDTVYLLDGKLVASIDDVPEQEGLNMAVYRDKETLQRYGLQGGVLVVINTNGDVPVVKAAQDSLLSAEKQKNLSEKPERSVNELLAQEFGEDLSRRPLIVVNGKRMGTSVPESVLVKDILSISVLKDDAARKKYGGELHSGVVEIELR